MKRLALVLLAACSAGPVQMTLELPSGTTAIDTTCVASVQVAALGTTYDQDSTDYKIACVDLPMAEPSLADIQAALHGQFTLQIPDTGLARVIVYGNSTSCASIPPASQAPITADLIFYAGSAYDGDDIVMQMVPSLSCKTSTATAMPVEMLALASTHVCSTSLVPTSASAGVNLGTLSPNSIEPGVIFSGGLEESDLVDGIATITNARTDVETGTCLALYAGDDSQDAISCAITTPAVCAGPGQLEVGVLPSTAASQSTDQTAQAQFGPPTFGLVYAGTGSSGAPVLGATVTLEDPTAGKVVYLDNNAAAIAGTGKLTALTSPSTNASGLFVVYTTGFHNILVSGGGKTATVTIGAQSGDPGTTIVRLQ